MSQDDKVPTVDPENERGKLEIAWVVVIALVVIVVAFAALKLTGRPAPPQKGLVGPSSAPTADFKPNGAPNSLVPAH